MSTKHVLINGDCRQMSMINNDSVHLIVTSPPYWQLKDYGNARQIGFNQTYEQYINSLNLVWMECYRILQPVVVKETNYIDPKTQKSQKAYEVREQVDVETNKYAVKRFLASIGKTYTRIDNQSLREEIEKAKLQFNDGRWEEPIKTAEAQPYLWGQIRCLLSWGQGNLETFE